MSAIQSIGKQNIADEVYRQLQSAIAGGEWAPGEKIPSENELAAQMGVSRVSVRAALQKLSSIGLIESRQGEGTFIRRLSGGECMGSLLPMMLVSRPKLRDMLEFRLILESKSVGLAAQRGSEEQVAELRRILAEHKTHPHETAKAAECDMQFHYLIAEMTGNPLIAEVYAVIKEVYRVSLLDIVTVMGTKNAEHYHGRLIEALAARDAAEAERVMTAHIQNTMEAAERAEMNEDTQKPTKQSDEG